MLNLGKVFGGGNCFKTSFWRNYLKSLFDRICNEPLGSFLVQIVFLYQIVCNSVFMLWFQSNKFIFFSLWSWKMILQEMELLCRVKLWRCEKFAKLSRIELWLEFIEERKRRNIYDFNTIPIDLGMQERSGESCHNLISGRLWLRSSWRGAISNCKYILKWSFLILSK